MPSPGNLVLECCENLFTVFNTQACQLRFWIIIKLNQLAYNALVFFQLYFFGFLFFFFTIKDGKNKLRNFAGQSLGLIEDRVQVILREVVALQAHFFQVGITECLKFTPVHGFDFEIQNDVLIECAVLRLIQFLVQ